MKECNFKKLNIERLIFISVLKDKKRNTYYFRVYVLGQDGKKVQKQRSGFKTKKECQYAESHFLLNYDDNIKKEIYFKDLFDIYIKDKEQSLKYQSFRSLKNRFDKHIIPYFKNYELNKIKARDYIEWKNYILSKNFSFPYCSSLHRAMVNILNFACNFYNLKENIAHKVGNFSSRNYQKRVNFWTFEEYKIFISKVDDFVYRVLFELLYSTGLRLGEALALKWNDIKDNYIIVNKTLIRKSINNCQFNTPKTSTSNRNVLIDNTLLDNLNKLKQYYNKFINFNDNWFVFGGIKPLATTTIERKKNNYCKLANVKQIKIHDFRHSHATCLLSKGVPPTVIQKRLGHSNLSMTLNVYSHLILNDEDKAVELLNKLKI